MLPRILTNPLHRHHHDHNRPLQRRVKRRLQGTGRAGKTPGQRFGVHPDNKEQPGMNFALYYHPSTPTREAKNERKKEPGCCAKRVLAVLNMRFWEIYHMTTRPGAY